MLVVFFKNKGFEMAKKIVIVTDRTDGCQAVYAGNTLRLQDTVI